MFVSVNGVEESRGVVEGGCYRVGGFEFGFGFG